MNNVPDVTCIGEVLVDFVPTQKGVSLSNSHAFMKYPGGAPANLAVGLVRLGPRIVVIARGAQGCFFSCR